MGWLARCGHLFEIREGEAVGGVSNIAAMTEEEHALLTRAGQPGFREGGAVNRAIIGVDPGMRGGIAMLDGGSLWHRKIDGLTLRDLCDLFAEQPALNRPLVWMENCTPQPLDNKAGIAKMMRNVGQVEAAIVAAHLPLERVTPGVWQKAFGLLKKKGETRTQKKNRHKAKAQELFPAVKVTHAIADALLIAEYGRRQERPPAAAT